MNYRLGLDIGITSVGWAILEHNEDEEPFRIANLGVRIFDAAENPKDGSALAAPRRSARSARRRLRRHRHRLERIKALIAENNILTNEAILDLYDNAEKLTDIYELRQAGLDRLLDTNEWTRVLINLAQRRGFKSNRKSESTDKEIGKLLSAVKENRKLMLDKGYRTVGEMLFLDSKFSNHKRNKADDYSHTIGREQVLEEITTLFSAQRSGLNPYANNDFEEKYFSIVSGQRSYDEGPGLPSPYAGNQIEKMVGKCTFEKDQPRAAKACYSFELFNLYQKINNIKLYVLNDGSRELNKEERQIIVNLAHEKADLNFGDIRKHLNLSQEQKFNSLTYGESNIDETERKSKFNYLKAYHQIRIVLNKVNKGRINQLNRYQMDIIGETLTLFKNENTITEKLITAGLSRYDVDELLALSFRGVGHLSLKAIRNILPNLEDGYIYSQATTLAGYNFLGHDNRNKMKYLPANHDELNDITNPVVRRSISQTIKVINSIVRLYGSPQMICIELTREMGKNFSDRKKIEKQIKENTDYNNTIRNKITELGHRNPSGQDIVKMKLWEEQDGKCAYSGEHIPIQQLFESGVADVDHIIPYSISFDDSYSNKVLVKSEENRQKGNLLPCTYLQSNPDKLARFEIWVKTNVRNYRKQQRLLKKAISEEDINKWKERQLNDTKFISRFMLNYIRDYLELTPSQIQKGQIIAVNGSITAYMRKRWGLRKERLAGDLHHAMDAVVVACVSQTMIRRITLYSQYQEVRMGKKQFVDYETGEIIDGLPGRFNVKFVEPWENFKIELESRLSDDPGLRIRAYNIKNYDNPDNIEPIFVSRMPRHKNSGPAHKDTIRSPRLLDEGLVVSKVDIKKLKLDSNGEIKDYYNPSSDVLLYNALKNRLSEYAGDGEKAFKETFYKPARTGHPESPVKKVKVIEKSTLNVSVGNGVAGNGDMLRIDFFKRDEGYYWVPIYVSDIVKPTLPNKAVIAAKPLELWPEMENEDFIFSLYPNDLIRFVHRDEVQATKWDSSKSVLKDAFMYLVKASISTGAITVESHDRSYMIPSLGVKTLSLIEKWNVDVLGRRNLVKNETRQYFPGQSRGD